MERNGLLAWRLCITQTGNLLQASMDMPPPSPYISLSYTHEETCTHLCAYSQW